MKVNIEIDLETIQDILSLSYASHITKEMLEDLEGSVAKTLKSQAYSAIQDILPFLDGNWYDTCVICSKENAVGETCDCTPETYDIYFAISFEDYLFVLEELAKEDIEAHLRYISIVFNSNLDALRNLEGRGGVVVNRFGEKISKLFKNQTE